MKARLTDDQFVDKLRQFDGRPTSINEVAKATRYCRSSVYNTIRRLIAAGRLIKEPGQWRIP